MEISELPQNQAGFLWYTDTFTSVLSTSWALMQLPAPWAFYLIWCLPLPVVLIQSTVKLGFESARQLELMAPEISRMPFDDAMPGEACRKALRLRLALHVPRSELRWPLARGTEPHCSKTLKRLCMYWIIGWAQPRSQ